MLLSTLVSGGAEGNMTSVTTNVAHKFEIGSLSLTQVGDFLFLLGMDVDTLTSELLRFDAVRARWTDVAPVPREGTIGSTAVHVDKNILVTGGGIVRRRVDHWTPTAEMHMYGILGDNWSRKSSCPDAVFYHCACVREGLVYVAGGYVPDPESAESSAVRVSASLRVFDLERDEWTQRADLLQVCCVLLLQLRMFGCIAGRIL